MTDAALGTLLDVDIDKIKTSFLRFSIDRIDGKNGKLERQSCDLRRNPSAGELRQLIASGKITVPVIGRIDGSGAGNGIGKAFGSPGARRRWSTESTSLKSRLMSEVD